MAGLTADGLTIKRLETIISDMIEGARNKPALGPDITDTADAVIYQLFATVAFEIADTWEFLEAIYDSGVRSRAEGVQLADKCNNIGVTTLDAIQTQVRCIVLIEPGTVIPQGSEISVDGTGALFSNPLELTFDPSSIVSASIDITTVLDSTIYTVTLDGVAYSHDSGVGATAASIATALNGEINSGSQDITSALQPTGVDITSDILFTSFELVASPGLSITVISSILDFEALDTGPILAPALTLNNIETTANGWLSVINPLAATLGRDVETDTELRLRSSESLQIAGDATAGAILSQVANLPGVTAAEIFVNRTSQEVDGRPLKSFEIVVIGGDNTAIAQTILDTEAVGIEAVGTSSEFVPDSQGVFVESFFSRPDPVWVHLIVEYTLHGEEDFPVNGEGLMIEAALIVGESWRIGGDVLPMRLRAPMASIPGLEEVVISVAYSATEFGAPGSFSTDKLPIGSKSLANLSSSRISVVVI